MHGGLTLHLIGVAIVGLTSGFPWAQAALFFQEFLGLGGLSRLQVIHFDYLSNINV